MIPPDNAANKTHINNHPLMSVEIHHKDILYLIYKFHRSMPLAEAPDNIS